MRGWESFRRGVSDYLSGESFGVFRCENCGLAITWPMPDDDKIERYYPSRYRGERQRFSSGFRVRRRGVMVERHFPRGFRGRLLDIGCGNGSFAVHMKWHGWDVAATEIDADVLQRLREQGIDARTASDAAANGFDRPFDAITCWHVLEHVPRPFDLAMWARGQLAPGGIFQVTVPNVASWQSSLTGGAWLHLDVPRHYYHFTPATLDRLLRQTGFEPVAWNQFTIEYDWFGMIQSPLNAICSRPNVLFEWLTTRKHADTSHLPRRDLLLSLAISPTLATVGLPFAIVESLARHGATLTVTARKDETVTR